MPPATAAALSLDFFEDREPPRGDFLKDAVEGLSRTQKALPPKYFYDSHGSHLFDRICETREYYVTRTETALLAEIGPEVSEKAGKSATIVEFGAGSATKVRLLLDALEAPAGYLAIDISAEHVRAATEKLAADYPSIAMGAICADFTQPIEIPEEIDAPEGRRVGFFPGSTIGNFAPAEAANFLESARALLGDGAALLIGVDLKKDPKLLDAAYNDADGVTAAFNLNMLRRLERELGARLSVEDFTHQAFYNEREGRVEMHLKSQRDQTLALDGHAFLLAEGETIHTENSYKYGLAEFQELAARTGFTAASVWTDPDRLFSIHWLEAC